MEIDSSSGAPVQAIIAVSNGANKQLKAVVGEIISGLNNTSAAIQDGVGQLLDVVA
jgi:hypothetical protein